MGRELLKPAPCLLAHIHLPPSSRRLELLLGLTISTRLDDEDGNIHSDSGRGAEWTSAEAVEDSEEEHDGDLEAVGSGTLTDLRLYRSAG